MVRVANPDAGSIMKGEYGGHSVEVKLGSSAVLRVISASFFVTSRRVTFLGSVLLPRLRLHA